MSIVEAIRAWLRTYPPLADGRLGVDFLPEDAQTYSVDTEPVQPVVKRYMDGSAVKQYAFVLASREFHADAITQNIENSAFYDAFSSWVEGQNRARNFPVLEAGRTARRIEVTSSGYPFQAYDEGTARYQIQLRLTYFERGDR